MVVLTDWSAANLQQQVPNTSSGATQPRPAACHACCCSQAVLMIASAFLQAARQPWVLAGLSPSAHAQNMAQELAAPPKEVLLKVLACSARTEQNGCCLAAGWLVAVLHCLQQRLQQPASTSWQVPSCTPLGLSSHSCFLHNVAGWLSGSSTTLQTGGSPSTSTPCCQQRRVLSSSWCW